MNHGVVSWQDMLALVGVRGRGGNFDGVQDGVYKPLETDEIMG